MSQPEVGASIHTIKVNVFSQRSRFYQLFNAMVKCRQVKGCFVTDYIWKKEQGEVYAIFLLYEENEEKIISAQHYGG